MTLRKKMRKFVLAVFALSVLASMNLAAQQQSAISLDGTWKFTLAKDEVDAEKIAGFYKTSFVPAGFVETHVPSNWAIQGFEDPHYKTWKGEASQGFYLHHFNVPDTLKEQRVLLHFEGVWSSAEVWLNGEPLGRHESGFTGFAFDVTSLLKSGADNLLAVRVRQTQHDYLFDANDDWSLGGIYRSVWIEAMPRERWIDRVDTNTTFDASYRDADLDVRVMVGDSHKRRASGNIPDSQGTSYAIEVTLKDQKEQVVDRRRIEIPAHYGTGRETIVRLHVLKPLHWTAETPNLYTVEAALLEDGKVSHLRTRAIGFRQISTDGGVFRVNGQPVKLRGVNRHDEYPDVGRATTPANWLQDLTLMKAANINFIRSSHYPPAQGFLDLCDKMGMYVEDEVPMGYGGDHANDPSFSAAIMLRSYETVERDLNHASIILWSIGNEDPLTSLHIASARTVKALDPTRPVLMPWRTEQWLPGEFDFLAPHYLTAEQVDAIAGSSTRPVLMTEYTHAYGKDGFGGLDDRWKALTRHSAGTGGAIWMWADQGIEVATRKQDGSLEKSLRVVSDGFDGIVGPYREPQRDYWETKAVYAQAYPAVDQINMISGQSAVRVPIQNDFDFTPLSAIKVRWALFADGQQLDSGSASVDAMPHATGWLEVPLDKLTVTSSNETTYLQLKFERTDGSELTSRSVELIRPQHAGSTSSTAPIDVERGKTVTIKVKDSTFLFDSSTGLLASAQWKQHPVLGSMLPTLWRPLTESEADIEKRESNLKTLPNLDHFNVTATDWQLTEHADHVEIHANVLATADANNHFSVAYDYTIHNTGTISIRYRVTPQVQVKWIAQTGISFHLPDSAKTIRWFGLGPLDTYPNEKAAGILGLYSGAVGSDVLQGNKTTRWIEAESSAGTVRFMNLGYLRIAPMTPQTLEILSHTLGRTSKGRRPEDPDQQLNVAAGQSYTGEIEIELHEER